MSSDGAIFLLKLGMIIIAVLVFINAVYSLIDSDWAWAVHEFISELKGRDINTLYRTESWEFWNKVFSIINIGLAIYMIVYALNIKTFSEWLHDEAPKVMQEMK